MNVLLRTGLWLGAAAVGAGAVGAAALWSGAYDVGADAPHTPPVYAVLEYARERSVAARARELQVPADLDDAERVRRGAGNYAAMCATCHLAPGAGPSELSRGLYPAPPNLARHEVDAASAFWTIKHGIKASGMPAWGGSMDDAHLWDLVAFLGRLPSLDAQGYRDWVARSDGHSHGGGEDKSSHSGPSHSGPSHGGPGHGAMGGHAHGEEGGHPHAAASGEERAHAGAPAGADSEHAHGHDDAPASGQAAPAVKKQHQHADGKTHQH